ncbi:hypothetical protein CROQUDRAFT_665170 [Cronartium quercuum f. sp. fusiforme G11]|uniref:F-box domain-containing protein n=1 Tax=Cronartium quercuum f. sp. fusiforme G11 TaxID=708437 RepID=A0A9P6NAZ4_9BASI|nr:hypothetical protein CROQUDRAFT_665170 [Cronartium quercuum f. sp. fusiforme G11]
MSTNTLVHQDAFRTGVKAFRENDFPEAICQFDSALEHAATTDSSFHIKVLDSRAAAKEQLQDYKGALSDAKRVINLRPELPKGYVRAARLFRKIRKFSSSIQMYDRAIARSGTSATGVASGLNTQTLIDEREEVRNLEAARAKEAKKLSQNNVGRLPFELYLHVIGFLDDETRFKCLRVCSAWRLAIYHAPHLWTTLTLTSKTRRPTGRLKYWLARLGPHRGLETLIIHYSEAWPLSELLSVLKTLTDRSGNGKLSIRLKASLKTIRFVEDRLTFEFSEFTQMLHHLIEFIMAHSSTLVTVDIKSSAVIYCTSHFAPFLARFPRLKRLRILAGKCGRTVPMDCKSLHRSPSASYPSQEETGINPKSETQVEQEEMQPLPRLESLLLQGVVFANGPVGPIQLDSLREISFPGQSVLPHVTHTYTALIDLANLPQLEQLIFGSHNARENIAGYMDSDWAGCLTLPRLKHLTINRTVQPLTHFLSLSGTDQLFTPLISPIAPQLRCLVLTDLEPTTGYQFLNKFAHEFNLLESLSLSGLALTPQTESYLIVALNSLPPLDNLCLNRTNVSLEVMGAIKIKKLKHLELVDCMRVSFSAITNLLPGVQKDAIGISYLDVTGCSLVSTREIIDYLRSVITTVVWQARPKAKEKGAKKLRLD